MRMRPPTRSRASSMVTAIPALARRTAAVIPAAPAPMTITFFPADIKKTGSNKPPVMTLDDLILEAQLWSEGDLQIVVTTIIKVHFVAGFKTQANGARESFDADCRIHREIRLAAI